MCICTCVGMCVTFPFLHSVFLLINRMVVHLRWRLRKWQRNYNIAGTTAFEWEKSFCSEFETPLKMCLTTTTTTTTTTNNNNTCYGLKFLITMKLCQWRMTKRNITTVAWSLLKQKLESPMVVNSEKLRIPTEMTVNLPPLLRWCHTRHVHKDAEALPLQRSSWNDQRPTFWTVNLWWNPLQKNKK